MSGAAVTPFVDELVEVQGRARLAVRRLDGPGRPFLLVHGLASNARLWDGVARHLAEAGHEVAAVDLRGHGRSEETAGGYDTGTAAADLRGLGAELGWTGPRTPVVAGQSWGGNVVLTMAARHRGAAAIALVDGGWIHLGQRFPTFEACWEQLAPPRFDHLSRGELEELSRAWHGDWSDDARQAVLASFTERPDGTVRPHLTREHHRSILQSLWQDDPRPLYSLVAVPALLMPAVDAVPQDPTPVTEALHGIPGASVSWYVGADHDLHAQQPARCASDLLALAARVDSGH